jgi:hypothetical protein
MVIDGGSGYNEKVTLAFLGVDGVHDFLFIKVLRIYTHSILKM